MSKKKATALTSVLIARSKVTCLFLFHFFVDFFFLFSLGLLVIKYNPVLVCCLWSD
jgi:hypothetical protein